MTERMWIGFWALVVVAVGTFVISLTVFLASNARHQNAAVIEACREVAESGVDFKICVERD